MIRAGVSMQAMRVIVLVLMALMIAPLAVADDFSFLFPSENLKVVRLGSSETMEDEDSDSHDCCPCMVCTDAVFEYSATVRPPEASALLAAASTGLHSSLYRPEILRPPIV